EDVRRVAGLQDLELAPAPGLAHLPGGGHERVDVLGDEAELATAGRVGLVLEQLDGVDDLERRGTVALRAHHGDLVARRHQRLALQPDTPFERHGQVLDDDQDAAHRPVPAWPRLARRRPPCPGTAATGPASPRPVTAMFIAPPLAMACMQET